MPRNSSGRCPHWTWTPGRLCRRDVVHRPRRRRCHPGVSLSAPIESAAVLEICRRLDGIPLAIELAASRMLSMTVTELRDRLDDRFRLLVGSRRGLERHQTLRHAVQWSYDLLDDTEKDLLARCSVFAGGFDLAGACAVADTDRRVRRHSISWMRCAQVASGRRSGRRGGHDSRCWRRSASSPKNNSSPLVTPKMSAPRTPDTSRSVRTTSSPCGTATPTRGLRVVDGRDGQPARGVPVGRRPRRPRHRGHHRLLRGVRRLLGANSTNPSRWAEELIEPARAANTGASPSYTPRPRCASPPGGSTMPSATPRPVRKPMTSGQFDEVRKEFADGLAMCCPYGAKGQPARWVDWCRNMIARRPDAYVNSHAIARGCSGHGLTTGRSRRRSNGGLRRASLPSPTPPKTPAWLRGADSRTASAHRGTAPVDACESSAGPEDRPRQRQADRPSPH